jgi:protein-tyrosine-phosphatase
VLEAGSAGLTPALNTTPFTRSVLQEKNVDLGDHQPRRFYDIDLGKYDLIVNMSGSALPKTLGVPVEEWNVDDPMGGSEDDFRAARETIEMLVMHLVLRARLGKL